MYRFVLGFPLLSFFCTDQQKIQFCSCAALYCSCCCWRPAVASTMLLLLFCWCYRWLCCYSRLRAACWRTYSTVVSSFLWLVFFLLLRTCCSCWHHGVASIQAVAHVPTVAEVLIDAVCCVPSVVGVYL
jgi:hypothetical protein